MQAIFFAKWEKGEIMEDNKFTCGVCRFSAFLVDEEDWWCPRLQVKVDPGRRPYDRPRTDLERYNGNAERDI